MKVCASCGNPATHKFFAERRNPDGKLARNVGFGVTRGIKDFLKHNRYRYTCTDCFSSHRVKLESMKFFVNEIEHI